jgi:YHS domain-containing protein
LAFICIRYIHANSFNPGSSKNYLKYTSAMTKSKNIIVTAFVILITSCHDSGGSHKHKETQVKKPDTASVTVTPVKYTMNMVVNQKDLSCYMSLADGIEDTAHYHGKVYGFCSKQCKEEFSRRPAYYVKD